MRVKVAPHDWSCDALVSKAQRYAEIMLEQDKDNWQFGFWSSLVLEHLARATLANVSPTLLADGKDWNNVYYSLGHKPSAPKFKPKSAGIVDLLGRITAIVPSFNRELLSFCVEHVNRRNEELHTGACPYDALGSNAWQPLFFAACNALLESLKLRLEDLFGEDEAKSARILIASLSDAAAKSVAGTIKKHHAIWEKKSKSARSTLRAQATASARRAEGHRVSCPACGSPALVLGTVQGPPTTRVEGDLIVQRQPMLPALFVCVACELKIHGFSKLSACGLGDIFIATSRYDAAEFFATGDDDYGEEPDYNENDL